jgi:hypothetical protein
MVAVNKITRGPGPGGATATGSRLPFRPTRKFMAVASDGGTTAGVVEYPSRSLVPVTNRITPLPGAVTVTVTDTRTAPTHACLDLGCRRMDRPGLCLCISSCPLDPVEMPVINPETRWDMGVN